MIIPGHAVLSMFSPPPEPQGIKEEGDGFGQLLTEVEHQTTRLPDQGTEERRALESVLQILMTMFQSFTLAPSTPAVSAPRARESGVASVGSTGGPAFGGPFSLVPPSGLGESGGINLPPALVTDTSHDIEQPTVPAADGQSTGLFSTTAVLQENMQDVRGRLLTNPTSIGAQRRADTGTPADRGLSPQVAASPAFLQAAPETTRDMTVPGMAQAVTLPRAEPPVSLQTILQADGAAHTGADSPGLRPTAVPGTTQAVTLPRAEPPVSLQTILQADGAAHTGADSPGLQPIGIAEEKAAFPEREHAPFGRRAPENEEQASESLSSMSHFTADHAFSSSLAGTTSHIPSAELDTPAPPPSHRPEDVMDTRQWPRPLPANTVLLHLEPRELGALLVQVRVSEKRIMASFRAQSPEAEALLRTHLPALQESLSQQGFEVQPIAITQAAEGFSTHLGAGAGTFTQQHSAFQAFTQDQQAAGTDDTQREGELNRIPRWPAEQRARLLDVVI